MAITLEFMIQLKSYTTINVYINVHVYIYKRNFAQFQQGLSVSSSTKSDTFNLKTGPTFDPNSKQSILL